MKNKPIAAALIALTILGGVYWWYSTREDRLPYIKATGTIEAEVTDLSPSIAGLIEGVAVEEGQEVKAGDLILQLGRDDLLAQRQRDAMNLAAAEANLANLESGPRPEEIAEARANLENLQAGARPEEIAQAEAAVKLALASADQAEADRLRAQQLYNAGALSEKELEDAITRQETSSASLESAQASLDLINAGTREGLIQAAEARLNLLYAGNRSDVIDAAAASAEASRAVLQATDALVSDLRICAPADGTVLSVNYHKGEYVNPGTAVVSIADLEDLHLKVYIATDDLPCIRLGQEVRCRISGSEREFQGRVQHIASQGEYTPKSIQTEQERANVVFAVKIAVDNQDGMLKPGMPADVFIDRLE